jgi:hypothetical protein
MLINSNDYPSLFKNASPPQATEWRQKVAHSASYGKNEPTTQSRGAATENDAPHHRPERNTMRAKITLKDPDIRGSLPALRRAARAARKRSRLLGSPFYVMKNGRIVDLNHKPRKSRKRKSA